jgi:hypothetical protein
VNLTNLNPYTMHVIWGSSVGIAMGCGLGGPGSIPCRRKRFFSTPKCPDRLLGPYSLLSNEYRGPFPRAYSGRSIKLTTHLHPVPRWRIVERYLHFPYIFMTMLNYLCTRIHLLFYLTLTPCIQHNHISSLTMKLYVWSFLDPAFTYVPEPNGYELRITKI